MLAACTPSAPTPTGNDFPSKTIRVVIPFGAGGGTDADTRAIVAAMDEAVDVSVIAENVSGGAGTLGLIDAMKRPADGHTASVVLLPNHGMGQVVLGSDYDLNDMEYLGGFTEEFRVIGTTADSGITSIDELLALGKQKGRLVVVSGAKSSYVVTAKLLADHANAQLDSIAYEDVPAAFAGLEAGDGDFWMGGAGVAQSLGSAINILAYAGPERSPLLPDVPTLGELGLDIGYLDQISAGLSVRGDLDPGVVQTLRDLFKKAVESDSIRDYTKTTGKVITYISPEKFKANVADAIAAVTEYKDILSD
jgi:tripartite-type tricarboxylate transporter receptor subunit TctC